VRPDKENVIVGEQMKRLRDEIIDEMLYDTNWQPPEYVDIEPNTPLDMVAFGIASVRIVKSAKWN